MEWNNDSRFFETGVDRVVLYVDGLDGVAWSGVTSINASPRGGEGRPYYIDGVKYLNLAATEELEGTIEAFYSPEEFDLCDGSRGFGASPGVLVRQQRRVPFCLSFRTRVGNEIDGADHAYKIHIIYNATASPASRAHESMSDSTDPLGLSWSFTTRAIPYPGLAPTVHITIDSSKVSTRILEAVERILYGTPTRDARCPLPEELDAIFTYVPAIEVIDLGDGTFSITGSDEAVADNMDGTFTITADEAVDNGDGTFTISST